MKKSKTIKLFIGTITAFTVVGCSNDTSTSKPDCNLDFNKNLKECQSRPHSTFVYPYYLYHNHYMSNPTTGTYNSYSSHPISGGKSISSPVIRGGFGGIATGIGGVSS